MTKKTKRKPPEVPRVNLLDPAVEPTDEELEALMRAMGREVRRKSARTKQASEDRLAACVGRGRLPRTPR